MDKEDFSRVANSFTIIISIALVCVMIWGIFRAFIALDEISEGNKKQAAIAKMKHEILLKKKAFEKDSTYFANGYTMEPLPCEGKYHWVKYPKKE